MKRHCFLAFSVPHRVCSANKTRLTVVTLLLRPRLIIRSTKTRGRSTDSTRREDQIWSLGLTVHTVICKWSEQICVFRYGRPALSSLVEAHSVSNRSPLWARKSAIFSVTVTLESSSNLISKDLFPYIVLLFRLDKKSDSNLDRPKLGYGLPV